MARLHISAYVRADCTNTCTCSIPSATFHRHPHRNAHASCSLFHSQVHSPCAQKSWGGHPRCDLAPLTTSFGTVALRERQHLAMAGSRQLHLPRNATAHHAARANSYVPRWRSGLAVPASCWSTKIPEGFRRTSSSAAVLLAYRRSRLFAVVFTRAFQRDCALRGFCSSSIARPTTTLVRAACKIPTISSALQGETMVFFLRGALRHFSLARDDYKFVPVLSPSSRSASVVPFTYLFTGTAIPEISENLRRRHLASTLNVCVRETSDLCHCVNNLMLVGNAPYFADFARTALPLSAVLALVC